MAYAKTTENLQHVLAKRINEEEAEIKALEGVKINTKHKALTNRTVEGEGARVGDYIGLGKALYVSYRSNNKYMSTDLIAYTYNNPDGTEIGSAGGLRTSRTMTPLELQTSLIKMIEGRKASLIELKKDLANAKRIVAKFNKINEQIESFNNSVTWATRSELKF